jgi:Icc-related predicted phosphoesterase
MAMELLESQADEKEMSEIDAVRIAGDVFKDIVEHGGGDFAELRKQDQVHHERALVSWRK